MPVPIARKDPGIAGVTGVVSLINPAACPPRALMT
jgi:hypothetical protein